jgi:SecD/SecF fusion protein
MFGELQPYLDDDATLTNFVNGQDYIVSAHKVGPTIADDIKRTAVFVIFGSLLIIFLYILARFRNWQFGLGALAALIHDVMIVIGLFSLLHGVLPFSLELDQSFIAAILTVVGYSINDTVVVFDRIREYVGLQKKRERKEIFNTALNSTLSRTFSTSLSTFFVLLAIFIFGGDVIRGFAFALLIGVVVGTYSSLFIATPVVYDTIKGSETTRVLKGQVRK